MGCVQSVPGKVSVEFPPQHQPQLPPTRVGAARPTARIQAPQAGPVLKAVPKPPQISGVGTSKLPAGPAKSSPKSDAKRYPSLTRTQGNDGYILKFSPEKKEEIVVYRNPQDFMGDTFKALVREYPLLLFPYVVGLDLNQKPISGSFSKFFLASGSDGKVYAFLGFITDNIDIFPVFFPGQKGELLEKQKEVVKKYFVPPLATYELNLPKPQHEVCAVYPLANADLSIVSDALYFLRVLASGLDSAKSKDAILEIKKSFNKAVGMFELPSYFLNGFKQLIRSNSGVMFGDVHRIILGLCFGLLKAISAAQENGFIFGDIKPANLALFCDQAGPSRLKVKIIDLWGCRIHGGRENPDGIFRTPGFLPQSRQKKCAVTPCFELDAHAVGVTILCVLIGPRAYSDTKNKVKKFSSLFERHPLKSLFDIAQELLFKGNLEDLNSRPLNQTKPVCTAFENLKAAYPQPNQSTNKSDPRSSVKMAAASTTAVKPLPFTKPGYLPELVKRILPLCSYGLVGSVLKGLRHDTDFLEAVLGKECAA